MNLESLEIFDKENFYSHKKKDARRKIVKPREEQIAGGIHYAR